MHGLDTVRAWSIDQQSSSRTALGTRMLRAFSAFLFQDPRVTSIQTDPDPQNARAIASYRKAGFRDVGVVDTLDGPALLMRITRE